MDVTPPAELPTALGRFRIVAFRFPDGAEHVAIVKGDPAGTSVLARVHSSCLTGDVLGSHRCDCGPQLEEALRAIEREGRGVVLYLNQEGRGIGLFNKIRAYHEQDRGANTVEANERLGFDADARSYHQAVEMLRHLKVESVRLMTNNPAKLHALEARGIRVEARVPHVAGATAANASYLATKRDVLGHLFSG